MLIIFIRFKFMEGAWVIILLVPIMVALLVRLNRQYEAEEHQLVDDAHAAVSARRSCAATSCSCSSPGSTRAPRGRSSTRGR